MADKIKKAKKQMVDSKTGKPTGKSETVVLTKSSVNEAFKKGGTVKAKNGYETPYEKAQRVVGIQQRNANVEKARQVARQTAMNLDKKRVELKEKGPEKPNSKDVVTIIKKKGGIMKTKMKTGGMVNPNKKATVTTKATKYTGGKNGTMMKGKGTKKK